MTEQEKQPAEETGEDIEDQETAEAASEEEMADAAGESGDAAGEEVGEAPGGDKTPEEEAAELKDRLLRALAENENLIRRGRREREDATKYAAANFARDMLNVADNLTRAMEAAPEEGGEQPDALAAFIEGVKLTQKELTSALERHGIVRISPMGEKFNHDLHEALFEVPTAEAEPGTIMQVVEDGYTIHDRLLRAARVGVAKAPADPPGDQPRELDTEA